MRIFSKALPANVQNWLWMFVFLASVGPGILSYTPYMLYWDQAYYAHRAICMNREFYAFSLQGMENCLAGTHKGPAIELVGLPWGPAGSTEAGAGLALVGLALFIYLLVLLTYWVSLRAGVAPWCLCLAGAAIGLTPLVRESGGTLNTDALVAWCSALTIMLISLEFRTRREGTWASFWRGGLWASVIMAGSLAKLTFAVFALAAVPVLLYARWRRYGGRSVLWTGLGAFIFAIPGLVVWILCGPELVSFGLRAAIGETAALWSIPGMNAGGYIWRFFRELNFALIPLAVLAFLFVRGIRREKIRIVPVAIVFLYLLIAAMGQNRDTRYTLTVAVTLPLALSWNSVRSSAHFQSLQFFVGLCAVMLAVFPMVARPNLAPVRHAGELLAELSHGQPATFMIATDGPENNIETFQLARQIGGASLERVHLDTLVYDAINKRTVDDGYRRMDTDNYVLFLKPTFSPAPAWCRQWAPQYRKYAEEHGALLDSQVSREFDVFEMKKP